MELSPGWIAAGAAVLVPVVGGMAAWWQGRLTEIRGTQKLLFAKHDDVITRLQNFELRVAETYVNREVLKEQLAPINKALEKIDTDLREMRRA